MEQSPKPAEAPKPKNRTILYAVIVIVLIVVGVSVYLLFQQAPSTPTGTPVSIWDTSGQCLAGSNNCGFKGASGNVNVTITAGTTITWTNTGQSTHTTTSCDSGHVSAQGCPSGNTSTEVWDSGILSNGAKYSHTFNTKGTFAYYCTLHPWMHGEIIVQ